MGLGAYLVTDQKTDDLLWNGYALADDDVASVAEFGEIEAPDAFLNEDESGAICWFEVDKGLEWLRELRAIVLRVASECERQAWAEVDEDEDDEDDEDDEETPQGSSGLGHSAREEGEDEFDFGGLDDDLADEEEETCHGPMSLADVADDVNLDTLEAVVGEIDDLSGWLRDLAGQGVRWALEFE